MEIKEKTEIEIKYVIFGLWLVGLNCLASNTYETKAQTEIKTEKIQRLREKE